MWDDQNKISGAILTSTAHEHFYALVMRYGAQYRRMTGVRLDEYRLGYPETGSSGETLWRINAQELTAFETLSLW